MAIEDEGEDFCEIYDDGFEFADEVISNAVESFLQDEENVSDLDFNIDNEIDYMLKDVIKEMFSEEIFDRYVEVCGNEWMS